LGLLSILAPFIDTPFLVKKGKLKYYSKLLLAENDNVMVIHGGTLFDYYFTLDKTLHLDKENFYFTTIFRRSPDNCGKKSQNLQIKATTYILNERTGKKIDSIARN
jgi:hypothetical protein